MSSLMNKVKEALHSDKSDKHDKQQQQQQQQQKDTKDTKDSRQSKSQPRSETEREAYERRQNEPYSSSENYGYGGGEGGTGTTATGGAYDDRQAANRGARGPAPRTDGPHGSDMANKMDPRVDSDRDYSWNMGMNPDRSATTGSQGYGAGIGAHETHGTHGAQHGTHGGLGAGADPRHDPDFESAQNEPRTGTFGAGTYGAGGYGSGTGTQGAGGYGTTGQQGGYGSSGARTDPYASTGPAPNTAGPHKSDMMNKMDPRVDSDLDGSKTYMGDKTYQER